MPKKKTDFLKVVKGIPFPEKTKRGRRFEYPFREMEIGDSFLAPYNLRNKIGTCIRQFVTRNSDYKFLLYKEGENFRVWRIPMDYDK